MTQMEALALLAHAIRQRQKGLAAMHVMSLLGVVLLLTEFRYCSEEHERKRSQVSIELSIAAFYNPLSCEARSPYKEVFCADRHLQSVIEHDR
jgi:hypothetical protein